MSTSPITLWQIEGEKVEEVTDFVFLGSKITVDSDCSHEIKKCLLLGRKAMTNLDSILKSRAITLPTKVCLVKAMVFPVWMWGLGHEEGWAQELMLSNCGAGEDLRVQRTLKEFKSVNPKGNQHWIFMGGTESEAKALIVWPPDAESTHWKRPWCWERLKAKREEGSRR